MLFGPLISPENLIASSLPIRLLDARPGPEVFAAGHLKGAIHADLNHWLSTAVDPGFNPAEGGRHPLPSPSVWAARLGAWAIGSDTPVVVYDDVSGGNGACRLWWMLRAFGHSKIAVLDGGLAAAKTAGLALTTAEPASPTVLPSYPCDRWLLPTVDLQAIEQHLEDPAWKVLDVRSRERWRGETEVIDPVAGRIPGTVNLPYTENLTPEGHYKSPSALLE